jgi:hypothetical protein
MSDAIFFAPLRVPLTDERTGLMSREWYLFFQAMFLRIGGTNGQSNDDLLQGIPEELGAAELLALQISAADGIAQTPPAIPALTVNDLTGELQAMRDQMAEITKRLDDIQQGTLL